MSQENVELVRDLLEAFQRRDHERAFDFYDPDIEWDATTARESAPDLAERLPGPRGRSALLAAMVVRVERPGVRDPGRA